MCFSRSKSTATQTTASTTVQRDERLAATDRSNVVSAKDGGSAALSVYNYDLSADVAGDALLYNFEATSAVLDFAAGIFGAAVGALDGASERANAFVTGTQAQFADQRETDTKQLLEQVVRIVSIGVAGMVAYQVMK